MAKLSAQFNRGNIENNLAAFRQGLVAIKRAEERARQPKQAPAAPAHKHA